jgi:purine-binding chemotaxis protein CheW
VFWPFGYWRALNPTPLQRALAAAPERAPQAPPSQEQEFFCFTLGELHLGVPSESVREVLRVKRITPMPRVPSFVLGVAGHRGEVLPVLDLLRFFGKGEGRPGPRARVFVGAVGSHIAGFLVDAVGGLHRYRPADILPAPIGGDLSSESVLGVVQQPGEPVVSLLNFAKLIQSARLRAVAR